MTSLAHQLKRLALPQNDASLLTRKEVASLLFEPKDAATIDRSTFYALGCTGLEELLGIEAAFQEFQDTLFSSASMTMERSVQSKEVNQKLDVSISLFLTRLCPYFLLKPAQKCLEWLIHRFHIQLYNVDSLLACILPYHDTNMFVRVLQLLNIQDATNKWNWLYCLQKPGVPLSRGALITHCYSDLGFMDFICCLVTKSIEAYSGQSGNCSQLRIIFSFYASTIVAALDAVDRVSDSIISKLLPYIQKGMKSPLQDYKAATYMIVCQLAVKVVMEATLVDKLAIHVSKSLLKQPLLAKEGVACLVVLLQNQQQAAIEPRALDHLSAMPALVSTLQEISAHDISPLLRHLLPHLVHAAFTPGSGNTDALAVLTSLAEAVPLGGGLDQTVARLLLDDYLSQTELSDHQMAALNQRLLPLVRLLESRYCGSLDSVLESHVTDISNGERKRLFHQFLSLSVSSGKFQFMDNSDTSLLLSLKHTQPTIRVSAMEHLMGVLGSGQQQSLDRSFLRDAVLERLQDDVLDVVAASLKVLKMLTDDLDPDDVVSGLLTLLHRQEVSLSESWLPVLSEAVRLLSGPWLGTGERLQTVGWRLLPLLVVSSSSQLILASCIGHSSIMAQQPLTKTWAKELDELMMFQTKPDFVGLANERLISTLRGSLADMQQLTRQDALEKLTLVVERLQGSGVATRVTFLVLMRTLLLSLGDLDEAEHLRTCERAYALLEPRLLEVIQKDGELQGELQAFIPSSFSESLTTYLNQNDVGYSSVLFGLLRDFISSLRRDEANASCKDDAWWNPEKLDSSACCYLGLLCRLFSVIISGAGEGPAAATCRELMKLLIQIHLPEPLMLFRFLCVLWGYGSNQSNQLDIKVGVILQTQALYVGGALLGIQSAATLEMLAAADSPVFPSLLLCLCSPVREVRRAALSALRNLSAASASPFQPITEKLLRTSEEIIADATYLSQALGALHDSCLAGNKNSQQMALLAALQQLLQSLSDPCCPSYSASVLLEALSQVNGESILSMLLPLLDRLLEQSGPDRPAFLRTEARLVSLLLGKYNEASAPLLAKDQKCLDLFIRVLGSSTQPFPDAPSYQICALEQMTKLFFSALGDEKVQQKLLSVMFDLLADSRSPLVANSVSSVFKAIAVDGQLVANELAPPEKPSSMTVLQTRRSRMSRRKPQEDGEVLPEGGAVSWRRVTLILELLQKKKKLKRPHMLVPVLFSLLARSMEAHSVDGSNMEYTKQLLLSCLLNVCHKVSPEGGDTAADVLDEDKFSVELVVQCIRTSDMPQTHHHGLLLLGAAAAIFPEKVLHNIMPIFTFMGTNVMRLDDAYSFQVIDKTVQMVVPALVQAQQLSGRSSSPRVDTVVTKIMHVFADALPHVPAHRRVPVLAQLVTLLGPTHYLWVLMALLFKLHATQAASLTNDKEAALQTDMDFWISVCCHFEVNEQLASLINILNFLLQLPDDKDDNAASGRNITRQGSRKKKEEAEEKVEELIFSVENHSSKELRHFKFICVSFMAQLLASNSFIGKVVDVVDDNESLEQLQQKLLQDILRYIHSVARCVEENAGKPTAKFWRVLLNKAYDVLDKVNSLLPPDTFITVVRGLMGNELASVRRKAMELLNNKLQHRTQWSTEQVNRIMELTDDLLKIACRSHSQAAAEEEGAEQAINRQTALYSLKLLSRCFGASHQEALLPVLKQTAALVTSPEEEKNVTGSALLCIAETVGVLKSLAIPQLPRLMPAVLHTLTDRKDLRSTDIYLLSAVTALQRVIETLPHFISPYLQDVISEVCRLTQLVESSSSSSSSSTTSPTAQLSTRLASLSSTLAAKLPPRVLLPTITKCYNSMVADRKAQLGVLMGILREHIAHMEKEELNAQQSELTAFFLTALDFRAEHCQGDLDKTAAVEGSVIDCLLAMVMKLSEVTFRPLFFKLFDWTKSSSTERLLTFYRLTDSVAGRLKGLFVLFAGNLVKPFTDLLRQTNTSKTGDVLFTSSNGEQKVALLLGYILDCMQKIFLYDTQRFLTKERADALMGPLLDQLENMVGGLQQYQQRMTQHLVPCVGQFIVALNDDAQWKNVNYQILLRSRHSHSQVRFSSLLLLLEVASKLKENYIVLLPETIPFLAELMEDECEEVEQQVQKVVQEMENILGEPLQSYF